MNNILIIIALFFSCYFILCIIKPSGITEVVLTFFCASTGCIIIWGYILSVMNQLSVLSSWLIAGFVTSVIAGLLAYLSGGGILIFKGRPILPWPSLKHWYLKAFYTQSLFIKLILLLLATTVVLTGLINLFLAITVTPHNWDSMATYLPKMAQYYQQNNLKYFDGDDWAQVVQPKNSSLLFLFAFLVSGHNENFTQLVQYFSYWVAMVGVYGIARKIGMDRSQAIFAAFVSSLLIAGIAQTTTNLNDMIITAYFGATVYFLFTFRVTHDCKYLLLAGWGLGLAIGTKASSLGAIPSVLLIALLVTRVPRKPKVWIKYLLILLGSVLLAVCAFALPSGYLENYRIFGNPIGNQDARDIHSFAGRPMGYILQGGSYNLLRYGFDFLSLDGLPPLEIIERAQQLLRLPPWKVLSLLNINLEDPIAINFFPFEYDQLPSLKDGDSYWGVLGFGLVWIVVLYSLFRAKKDPDAFVLALAAILFLFGIAYSGPYDSSRGRYFLICAIFAAPIIGVCLSVKHRLLQAYLLVIILLGCISAFSVVIYKTSYLSSNFPEQLEHESVFLMDRIEQLTFNNPKYYQPLVAFEHLVPSDATVAIFLYPNTFEYPLYGKYINRRIISINSFYRGMLRIPPEAQYLLYARGYPCALPDDIHLGADWFLRKLSDENRECSSTLLLNLSLE